jgi:hypothetical protein
MLGLAGPVGLEIASLYINRIQANNIEYFNQNRQHFFKMSQNPKYFIQKPRALTHLTLFHDPKQQFCAPTSIFDIFISTAGNKTPNAAAAATADSTTQENAANITVITEKTAEMTIAELTPPPTPLSSKSSLFIALSPSPAAAPPNYASTLSNLSVDKLNMKSTQFLNSNKYEKLIIGAIMFQNDKILLLKRHPSAPAMYPLRQKNSFELPSADVEDDLIYNALTRQAVFQHAGMNITTVIRELLPPMECEFLSKKNGTTTFESCLQLNFVVDFVPARECVVDLETHCESRWVTEMELDGIDMTPAMRKAARNAFEDRFAGSQ